MLPARHRWTSPQGKSIACLVGQLSRVTPLTAATILWHVEFWKGLARMCDPSLCQGIWERAGSPSGDYQHTRPVVLLPPDRWGAMLQTLSCPCCASLRLSSVAFRVGCQSMTSSTFPPNLSLCFSSEWSWCSSRLPPQILFFYVIPHFSSWSFNASSSASSRVSSSSFTSQSLLSLTVDNTDKETPTLLSS